MPKWPRLRKGDKRGRDQPAAPPTRPRPTIDASAVSGVRGASWDRPPSAEELKAAFQKRRPTEPEAAPSPPPKKSEFEELFSNESLYVGADAAQEGEPADESDRAEPLYDPVDPWSVLDLDRTASWPEVVAGHRRLALRYHPDRLVDATEEAKEEAADRIREINIAYSTIKRRMGR